MAKPAPTSEERGRNKELVGGDQTHLFKHHEADGGEHDRREHHLEHGPVGEPELRRQLAGAAEPGALQREAEARTKDEP